MQGVCLLSTIQPVCATLQEQVLHCSLHCRRYTAGATLQVLHCRCYTAGTTLQALHCRCYTVGATLQVLHCSLHCRCYTSAYTAAYTAGATLQVLHYTAGGLHCSPALQACVVIHAQPPKQLILLHSWMCSCAAIHREPRVHA